MRRVSTAGMLTLASLWAAGCATAPPQRPGTDPRDAEQVRQWGLAHGWTEVRPDPPPGPRYQPTDADRQRGFFVFVPDRNKTPLADRMPAAGSVPGRGPQSPCFAIGDPALAAMAFPGESEGLGIGVVALKDLDAVVVEVSDLVGPGGGEGSRVPAAEIRLRDVIYAPLSLRNRRKKKNLFSMQPMWLLGHAPRPLEAGRSRLVWLTVPIPDDAPPGRYVGAVSVRVGQTAEARRIELDVQPFRLDGSLCSWVPVTGGNGFDVQLYRQLAEHHCTGLSWWWGHWGLTVTRVGSGEKAKAGFDPAPLDLLNAVTREAGMRGPWILMLGNQARGHLERRIGGLYATGRVPPLFDVKLRPHPRRKAGDDGEPNWPPSPYMDVADLTDSREMDRRYVEVLGALADRAKAKGYPQIIIIPYDEPSVYLRKWNAHWAALIRRHVPQFKVLNTPQGVPEWAKKLMPHSDLMVTRGADDPIYDMAIKAGKGVVGYGRLTADMDFARARHALATRFAEHQPRAVFFWALNFGRLNKRTPFNDLNDRDSAARHRFAWPPASPGQPWIETLVWEAQREGAKDYLLLLMLEKALAGSTSTKAVAIRTDLGALKHQAARNAVDPEGLRARLAQWYRALTGP